MTSSLDEIVWCVDTSSAHLGCNADLVLPCIDKACRFRNVAVRIDPEPSWEKEGVGAEAYTDLTIIHSYHATHMLE